jgi:hypothetical protein
VFAPGGDPDVARLLEGDLELGALDQWTIGAVFGHPGGHQGSPVEVRRGGWNVI